MTILEQVTSPPQAMAEVVVNENFVALEHMAVYGKDATTTTALVWGYLGGRWGGFPITAGTLTLTASLTNYVVVAKATGVISTSTASTNWNDSTNYARVYKITTGTGTVTAIEGHRAGPGGVHYGGGSGSSSAGLVLEVAASDESTALTTGNGKITTRASRGFTLSGVRASLTTAQATGSAFTVDVKKNGTTVLSTLLSISNTAKTSTTASTPAVISTSSGVAVFADDDEIRIDITQVGDGTAKGLKVRLYGI